MINDVEWANLDGNIVSIKADTEGRAYELDYDGPISDAVYELEVAPIIRGLRKLPNEFLVVNINYPHQDGIIFLQTLNEGDCYEIEIAIGVEYGYDNGVVFDNANGKYKMYYYNRDASDVERAVEIFRLALVREQCSGTEWIDMTADVLQQIPKE